MKALKKDIIKFFGVWKNNREIIKIFDNVYKERKNLKLRTYKF